MPLIVFCIFERFSESWLDCPWWMRYVMPLVYTSFWLTESGVRDVSAALSIGGLSDIRAIISNMPLYHELRNHASGWSGLEVILVVLGWRLLVISAVLRDPLNLGLIAPNIWTLSPWGISTVFVTLRVIIIWDVHARTQRSSEDNLSLERVKLFICSSWWKFSWCQVLVHMQRMFSMRNIILMQSSCLSWSFKEEIFENIYFCERWCDTNSSV
jgi:hypothetical protein